MLITVGIGFVRAFMPVVEKYNKIEFRFSWKSDIRVWKLIFISFSTAVGAAYKRVAQKI